jgi:hypothetical protein
MENKELFIEALETMLYSGGGDPTPESHWDSAELKKQHP